MSLGERDSAQLEVKVPERETGTACRWTSLRSVIVNCAHQSSGVRCKFGLPDAQV